ncbi:MAG TPA: hypothetical protein VGO25_10500 [Rhodanobacteraceae bacterium]|nr:hypothetical protein [Rhodanobacteraceae bacterium]
MASWCVAVDVVQGPDDLPHVGLVDRTHRKRQSHAIALAVRPALAKIGGRYGASVKIVEVPPGPPVLAPIVAEIYCPSPRRSDL